MKHLGIDLFSMIALARGVIAIGQQLGDGRNKTNGL
jgi:hypothetical protein